MSKTETTYEATNVKVTLGGEELSFKGSNIYKDHPTFESDLEITLKCSPEVMEDYKRLLLGIWDTDNLSKGFPSTPDYVVIKSIEELPEDKIVYQLDSGWWYNWDLSGKSQDELETLFRTNIIYKKGE